MERVANCALRAWFIDVSEEQKEAELLYLQNETYRRDVDIPVRRIDAYSRFSGVA